jgi:hypothetical protein
MKVVCFPHFYYLSEVSRLVEIGLALRRGAGLMLSKWKLNRRSLSRALERLLSDAGLRENMLRLKDLQDKVDGPANAAREIVNFLGASNPKIEQTKRHSLLDVQVGKGGS